MTTDNAARYLAQNIESLRRKKRLSQQKLAELAELPRSTLTHIESGSGNPSLANLVKISSALGVSIEELLSRPHSDCRVFSADEIPIQLRSHGRVKVFRLLPDRIKGIDIDRLEFEPGAVMGGHPHLPGTKEYLTVIKGDFEVHVAGERFQVSVGEVLSFPGNQPHSYRNTKSSSSVAISVVIPVPASL